MTKDKGLVAMTKDLGPVADVSTRGRTVDQSVFGVTEVTGGFITIPPSEEIELLQDY